MDTNKMNQSQAELWDMLCLWGKFNVTTRRMLNAAMALEKVGLVTVEPARYNVFIVTKIKEI